MKSRSASTLKNRVKALLSKCYRKVVAVGVLFSVAGASSACVHEGVKPENSAASETPDATVAKGSALNSTANNTILDDEECIIDPAHPERAIHSNELDRGKVLFADSVDNMDLTFQFCKSSTMADDGSKRFFAETSRNHNKILVWNFSVDDYTDDIGIEGRVSEGNISRMIGMVPHELTHRWQYQNPELAGEECGTYIFSVDDNTAFTDLCNEQQAQAIENYDLRFLHARKYRSIGFENANGGDTTETDRLLAQMVEKQFPHLREVRLEMYVPPHMTMEHQLTLSLAIQALDSGSIKSDDALPGNHKGKVSDALGGIIHGKDSDRYANLLGKAIAGDSETLRDMMEAKVEELKLYNTKLTNQGITSTPWDVLHMSGILKDQSPGYGRLLRADAEKLDQQFSSVGVQSDAVARNTIKSEP